MTRSARLSPGRRAAYTAVFCAVAFLTVLLPSPKVQFLTFDIKDTVIAIAALLLGPGAAVSLSLAVPLLEMVTVGTTGFYGLVMDILSSLSFSLVTGTVYRLNRRLSGAVLSLSLGVLSQIAVMMAANLLVTPFYTGLSVFAVAEMILPLLLPFNLTKAVLNAALVMILYKPVTNLLRRAKLLPGIPDWRLSGRSAAVFFVAAGIFACACVVLFFVLRAAFV